MSFSFQFWKQSDFFGLDNEVSKDPKWFVSLLAKLQDLSKYEADVFRADRNLNRHWRYHPIDWDATNVPVRREQCTWIHADYLGNPIEYPFVQFQVSMAFGRVVGFWENTVFYIVLLDPMHNIQPSVKYNHTTWKTKTVECSYTDLLCKVDGYRKEIICDNQQCSLREDFATLARPSQFDEAILIPIDDDDWQLINEILTLRPGMNLSDILRSGISAQIAIHTEPAIPAKGT